MIKRDREAAPVYKFVREPLHEVAARHIRDMIVKGELQPGARLHEQSLSEVIGISRTPIREAIRALAAEGLVRLLPNKGAVVHDMSVEEVLDAFQVIGVLDSLVGELAVGNMTPADLADLEALHEKMKARFEAGELFAYFKVNQDIHRRLLRMAASPALERQLQALNAQVQPFRFSVNIDRESWERSMRDHETMMALLRDRDGPGLARVLREHLPKKADVVRHAFAAASVLRKPPGIKRRKATGQPQ